MLLLMGWVAGPEPGPSAREAAHIPPLGEAPHPSQSMEHSPMGLNSSRGEERRNEGHKEGLGAPRLEEAEEQPCAMVSCEG